MMHSRIPDRADQAVQFVLHTILDAQSNGDLTMSWWRVEAGAGVGTGALRCWLYRNFDPKIGTVRRALNALGYDLAIVSLEESVDRADVEVTDARRALRIAEDGERFLARIGR